MNTLLKSWIVNSRLWAFRELRPRILLPIRKALHKPQLLHYPHDFFLTLGTTNTCNARCVFCAYPKASDEGTLSRGTMPRELSLEAFRQWAEAGMKNVGIQPIVGDPLIDPLFIDRVRQAHCFDLRVTTTTNGILLPRFYGQMVDCGVDFTTVSIGGTTREWYKKVYQVDKYDEVIDGLRSFLEYNLTKGEPCEIRIGFRNAQPTREILQSMDYKRHIKPFLSRRVKIEWNADYVNWGGWIKKAEMPNGMSFRKLPPFMGRPCEGLRVLYLRWNGNVRSCGCAFIKNEDDEMIAGQFPRMSLREIAESNAVQAMMDGFYGDGSKRPEVCKTCTNYTPIYNRDLKI